MMQKYFGYLSFDGTNYHGWQVQPNANSVQAEIQKALSIILRQPIEIVGAGRTDSGVHARLMVIHFDCAEILDGKQLAYKLNRLLPQDISIHKIEMVDSNLHARFSAKWRTYHYYVHRHKNPFRRFHSCELFEDLDFDLMNEAAKYLLEVKDFASFCKTHTDVKTTFCNVVQAEWIRIDEFSWYFSIKADRFLRNMVRAVVGTLIEVGRHRITLEEFYTIVQSRKRTNAGESMPAKALFLENIEY